VVSIYILINLFYYFTLMKKNIAIVMGGFSSEVNISLKSGNVVYNHLDRKKYNPFRVHILKEKWVVLDDDANEYSIDKNDFSFKKEGKQFAFDCVFNAIHGAPGENGELLAYFNLIGIKHTSAPFYQMALTFNKRDTLSVVKEYGVKTAISVYLNKGDVVDLDKIINKVGLPCFVKPNNAGSSYGISKAHTKEAILPAIEKAYKEDSAILIESFLDGTEVSVGVIEYNGAIKVLPITEIVSENDFFDYEAKYEGKSEEITPARISKEAQSRVEAIAKKVYKILDMSGFTRSEYIFVNDEPHFIEINTVPGLTEESILPQQANAAGISFEQLFDNAIKTALLKS
jgi:D-alanine-D-alanine ligase